MKTIITLIILVFFQVIILPQNDGGIQEKDSVTASDLNESLKVRIGITVRSYSDSVIIRWAVTKPAVWSLFKKHGFILEKARVLQDGSYGEFSPVKEGVFKPWTNEQWNKYLTQRPEQADTTQADYDALASLLAVPEEGAKNIEFESSGNEIQDIKDRKSAHNWPVLFAVLSSNASVTAAEGLGLRYVDKDVKPGESYAYKIYLAGESPVYIIEEGIVEVKVEPYNPDFAKQEITAVENDGSINLIWKSNDRLITYKVERSEDKGKTFQNLTKVPLLTLKSDVISDSTEGYLDTLVTNYKPYIYRIYGTTPFADDALVGEIEAIGRDRTPPEQPFVPQPQHISDNEIKITWEMSDNPAKDLKGFYVGRDSSASGEFKYITDLLPHTSREFIDGDFIRGGSNFYLVEAVDTAGNISQSYPVYTALNDTVPPLPPKWIKGKIDTNGVVTLQIESNVEKDLMGYRILRANSPEHEFSSIIESFGDDSVDYAGITIFTDTVSLETTTPYVYYRATALDNRYNESEFSDILAVRRPDIIAPTAPVITDVSVTGKSVTLLFVPSASEDVHYHILFRKETGAEKPDSISALSSSDTTYTDKNVKPNIVYEYALLAVDSSGLRSKLSFPVSARPYYTGVLPSITNFKIQYNEKQNESILNWDYENSDGIYFVIYRSFSDTSPGRYATIKEAGTKSFTDTKLNGKGIYSYSVKVFDNLGGESKKSENVNVDVQ